MSKTMDKKSFAREKKKLLEVIKRWNESRVDLFEITKPNENLEFHGVMRFYHQDGSDRKYATKCIRVSNNNRTTDVIEMLATKFRPDMKMLTAPKYALYEVHEDEDMRKLDEGEYPLLVQLNWGRDDLEGRFLLHNEDLNKNPPRITAGFYDDKESEQSLSTKGKKQKKKLEKKKGKKRPSVDEEAPPKISEPLSAAQELYNQVPESTFTRTVSNPEAVMKKRREQKLQKKGAEQLKIYGDRINPEHPYKSLLLLPTDKVPTVIQDALSKYGMGREKVSDYSIIKVVLPPNSKPEDSLSGGWGIETNLTDEDCPLAISQDWQPHKGTLVFQLRHNSHSKREKPKQQANHTRENKRSESEPTEEPHPPERKKHKTPPKKKQQQAILPPATAPVKVTPPPLQSPPATGPTEADMMGGDIIKSSDPVPKILEFSSLFDDYNVHVVSPNITEIGSDRRTATYGPFIEVENKTGVLPTHCVLANMDGVVTVTPHEGSNVEVFVDGRRIDETCMLNHSSVLWLGRKTHLVYCKPNGEIVVPYVVRQIKSSNPNRKVISNLADFTNQRRNVNQSKSQTLPLHAQPPKAEDFNQKGNYSPRGQSTTDLRDRPQTNGRPLMSGTLDRKKHTTKPHTLPCTLQINKQIGEESFVSEIVNINGSALHFKLSPAYTIYLSLRDIVEHTPKVKLEHAIEDYMCVVTDLLDQTIQMNRSSAPELAFWMANASELLNFLRQDRDLSPATNNMQDVLAKTVQLAFRHLVQCMQMQLFEFMPAFLSVSDDDIPGGEHQEEMRRSNPDEEPNMYDILHMLSSAMVLLRRCRVNAALTIQLFSQLFHFINMWIFNEVVCKPEQRLCCRVWGIKIRTRLARVEAWAEKQGLELAADCHLARVTQAMHLLQAPKQTAEDIAAISGTCFKLNSLQLRALLSNYEPSYEQGEREIPNELIDNVVAVAESTADELTRSDGRDVCLEEDPDLQLPFLLPEDGYSCDVVRSMPSGLKEFLKNLQREELCIYNIIPEAPGSWTVHFTIHSARESVSDVSAPASHASSHSSKQQPEVVTVTLHKKGGGMGLSIVAAKGAGQEKSGIYIRSVVKGGAAYHDRRLQAGDQLLNVDGHTLVGVTQERAAELMTKTGQTVSLTVAKQGAVFHRLATLLSQPTPPQQRAGAAQRRPNAVPYQSRPKSDGYALSQAQGDPNDPYWKNQENTSPAPAKSTANISYNSNENNSRVTGYNRNKPDHVQQTKPHYQTEDKYEKVQPKTISQPRPAMSMGNLQSPTSPYGAVKREDESRNLSRQQKRAQEAYQRQRIKAASQSALSTANEFQQNDDANWRKREVQNLIMQKSPRSPKDAYYETTQPRSAGANKQPQFSVDNPNYEMLPPPPAPPSDNSQSTTTTPRDDLHNLPPPPEELHNDSSYQNHDSPKPTYNSSNYTSKYDSPKQKYVESAKTTERPSSGQKEEMRKPKALQKSTPASKSSTLPRHFKPQSTEQAIQEQLNALRDEEIEELSAKFDTLKTFEKDRLDNLLNERDFQRRVQEESRRYYSDEDDDDEYIVPDRPDRDRLLQMQAANEADTPQADQEERLRKQEEERTRKEKEEEERREKEERERIIRERLEKERLERKQDEEEKKHREKYEREEAIRLEKERRLRERERWEEEKWQKEQEEIQRHQEEEERRRKYEREEYERQQHIRELQRQREEQESALRDIRRNTSFTNNDEEDSERELLEQKLSEGKPSNFTRFSSSTAPKYAPVSAPAYRKPSQNSYVHSAKRADNPAMRDYSSRSARPVSDGYMLHNNDVFDNEQTAEVSPPRSANTITSTPPSTNSYRGRPISYINTEKTPTVIGAQERYKDPRDRREETLKREQNSRRRQPDPSQMTFRDRQKLFTAGNTPTEKPRASKKLLELQHSLM